MRAFLWGRKMPLPNILEFIGTTITQRKFQEAQGKLLNYLGVEVPTKTELNSEISKVNNAIAPKADKVYVDNAFAGFTNGASKWYATLDLANADIANITVKDKVEIGEIANGGTWYKATASATNLSKSSFDSLTQAKIYADQVSVLNANEISKVEVSKIATATPSALLHVFSDKNGQVYAYFDENGHLRTVDLPDSLQNEIIGIKEKTNSISQKLDSDLYQFIDSSGNLVAKIDENGQFFLTGLTKSVQEYLLNIGIPEILYSAPKPYKTIADTLTPEVNSVLQSNNVKAPIGRGMLPQQYHLGKNWIKNLSMPV